MLTSTGICTSRYVMTFVSLGAATVRKEALGYSLVCANQRLGSAAAQLSAPKLTKVITYGAQCCIDASALA